ncbi:MAG: hypothetical protein WBL62_05375 [Gallionella sp.]
MNSPLVIGTALGNMARPSGPSLDSLDNDIARIRNRNLQEGLNNWKVSFNKAMGTIHNVRAKLNARVETEEELLAQLKEAGVSVPLSDPKAFTAMATQKYFEKFEDEQVIKTTYETVGVLPRDEKEYIQGLKDNKEAIKWHR